MAFKRATRLRCGPMHCTLRRLFGDDARVLDLLPAEGRQVRLVHRGRVAVWWAATLLGLKPGDEVLVPAYHCGSEIDPLTRLGLNVRAYDVGEELTVEVAALAARATPSTRAVYVIHYFGVAQDLSDLASWCAARSIKLIEDCAVALFAEGPEGPVGCAGDAAIFSFRKTLPVPDGGAVLLHEGAGADAVEFVPPPARANTQALAKLLAGPIRNWVLAGSRDSGLPARPAESLAPLAEADRFDLESASWAMSKVSRRIAGSTDVEAVRRARRANFARLVESLPPDAIVRPLIAKLPPGACPVVCPMVTKRRDELYGFLRAAGVAAIPWWSGCHEAIDWRDFPAARRLKDGVVALPVHQMLGEAHMDYLMDCVHRFSAEHDDRRAATEVATTRG